MAQTAKERRAAQRRTARIVRQNRELRREQQTRIVDLNIRQRVYQARLDYATRVMNGEEPAPAKRSREGDNLAGIASFAAHGQADPQFEVAFSRYWYHYKGADTEDIEVDITIEDDDEDSSEE